MALARSAAFAPLFTVSLDMEKLRVYCEEMAEELTIDECEGYDGPDGPAKCRAELVESWAADLLSGSGLDRFDARVEVAS